MKFYFDGFQYNQSLTEIRHSREHQDYLCSRLNQNNSKEKTQEFNSQDKCKKIKSEVRKVEKNEIYCLINFIWPCKRKQGLDKI